ncbi:hypothetical protein BACINT_03533 [Bacteroides intestinalis DSM 17393]|uniref:Uncharacterized protein n=1 Tax=Bacteroides intestinalis DSM 17393 TaxID=471870 RepID=B3CBE6_9BACE|nr:hypothetical protein BACINT_03533 [Bacteroides intestinalis DSM 17393]
MIESNNFSLSLFFTPRKVIFAGNFYVMEVAEYVIKALCIQIK